MFQGGIGIKRSLDELAGTYLRHELSEAPRLVSSVSLYGSVVKGGLGGA